MMRIIRFAGVGKFKRAKRFIKRLPREFRIAMQPLLPKVTFDANFVKRNIDSVLQVGLAVFCIFYAATHQGIPNPEKVPDYYANENKSEN